MHQFLNFVFCRTITAVLWGHEEFFLALLTFVSHSKAFRVAQRQWLTHLDWLIAASLLSSWGWLPFVVLTKTTSLSTEMFRKSDEFMSLKIKAPYSCFLFTRLCFQLLTDRCCYTYKWCHHVQTRLLCFCILFLTDHKNWLLLSCNRMKGYQNCLTRLVSLTGVLPCSHRVHCCGAHCLLRCKWVKQQLLLLGLLLKTHWTPVVNPLWIVFFCK